MRGFSQVSQWVLLAFFSMLCPVTNVFFVSKSWYLPSWLSVDPIIFNLRGWGGIAVTLMWNDQCILSRNKVLFDMLGIPS